MKFLKRIPIYLYVFLFCYFIFFSLRLGLTKTVSVELNYLADYILLGVMSLMMLSITLTSIVRREVRKVYEKV